MAEIFSAGKEKAKEVRRSIAEIRRVVGKTFGDYSFTSFSIFPSKVCFETQGNEEQVVLFMRQH